MFFFFGDLCIKFGRFVHPEVRRIDYLSKKAKERREKKKK